MITEEDIIYMAGLFDGEGSYYIQKNKQKYKLKKTGKIKEYKPYYFPVVSLSMIDKDVVLWILEKFGGLYREYKPNNNMNTSVAYQWRIYRFEEVKRFMNMINPYTKIKKINCPSNKDRIPDEVIKRLLEKMEIK